MSDPESGRRRYHSPLRRQRAAETRDRIVAAGAELVHEGPVWDWRGLTFRAVAERAGVNERTVYRHFPSERDLRAAVLRRLQDEAGIGALDGLKVDEIADVTRRTFAYVSSFPVGDRGPRDPAHVELDARRRELLLEALAAETPDWPDGERATVAAMFDVLWSLVTYERLVAMWGLDPERAATGVTWVMGLIEDAIREGRGPGTS